MLNLIGPEEKATISDTLSSLGKGLEVLGQMEMKVVTGKGKRKICRNIKV